MSHCIIEYSSDVEQKCSISKLVSAADQIIPWVDIVSVEILDIDTDCYSKRIVQNQPA